MNIKNKEKKRRKKPKKEKKEKREDKKELNIEFKDSPECISLETVQKLILCCLKNEVKCKILSQVEVSLLHSVNLFILPPESKIPKECKFISKVKEVPTENDIVFYLCTERKKIPKHNVDEEVNLTNANVLSFLLKRPDAIYMARRDFRLRPIAVEDKIKFFSHFVDDKKLRKSIIFTLKEKVKVVDRNKRDRYRKDLLYKEVVIRDTTYITYLKKTKHSILGIDCEMVITEKGKEVGIIALVNAKGELIYKRVVKPSAPILDYLTEYSGIKKSTFINKCKCIKCITAKLYSNSNSNPHMLKRAQVSSNYKCVKNVISIKEMHRELSEYIGSRTIIVGHGLNHDMNALRIYHTLLIDTSFYFSSTGNYQLKLKDISHFYLDTLIQTESHSPEVDAAAAIFALGYLVFLQENNLLTSSYIPILDEANLSIKRHKNSLGPFIRGLNIVYTSNPSSLLNVIPNKSVSIWLVNNSSWDIGISLNK